MKYRVRFQNAHILILRQLLVFRSPLNLILVELGSF